MGFITLEAGKASEKLHNELAQVIIKRADKLETIILVLDMLKYDLLKQANEQAFGDNVKLSKKTPSTIWSHRKFLQPVPLRGKK